MLYNMYSVKDELNGKFMNPMFVENNDSADSMATRQFKSNVNDISLWRNNPNDFSLYLVGMFDDEEGVIVTPIKKVVSGRSVLDV